jgi:hypothetical protein
LRRLRFGFVGEGGLAVSITLTVDVVVVVVVLFAVVVVVVELALGLRARSFLRFGDGDLGDDGGSGAVGGWTSSEARSVKVEEESTDMGNWERDRQLFKYVSRSLLCGTMYVFT